MTAVLASQNDVVTGSATIFPFPKSGNKKRQPMSAFGATVRCFTADVDGLHKGIVVGKRGFDPVILLGSSENGGHESWVRINLEHPPMFYENDHGKEIILAASAKETILSSGRSVTDLLDVLNHSHGNAVLVKVVTGHKSFARSEAQRTIVRDGNPIMIYAGRVNTKPGQVRSQEHLWRMTSKDAVSVVFADMSVRTLRFRDDVLVLERDPSFAAKLQDEYNDQQAAKDEAAKKHAERAAAKKAEQEAKASGEARQKVIETAWKQVTHGPAVENKDGGLHGLMDVAAAGQDIVLWRRIGNFLRGSEEKDVRPGVLRRFLELSPAEVAEQRSWAGDLQAKRASLKQACEGVAPKNRDGGRHGLINLAVKMADPKLWLEIGNHLREYEGDLRPVVLNRFIENCLVTPEFEEILDWASNKLAQINTEIAAKRSKPAHHSDLPDFLAFIRPKSTVYNQAADSNLQSLLKGGWRIIEGSETATEITLEKGEGDERRTKVHQKPKLNRKSKGKAARQADDQASDAERKGRKRPGQEDGKSSQKKKGEKKK